MRTIGRRSGLSFARRAATLLGAGIAATLLFPVDAGAQQLEAVRVVSIGDPLTYFKGTEDPPAGWNTLEFNDAAWEPGASPLGYGDGGSGVNYGTELLDMVNAYMTVYTRQRFTVNDLSRVGRVRFTSRYDDGFVVYINGTEVRRFSMPAGVVNRSTAASDHEFNVGAATISLTPALFGPYLKQGANVLAIEIHNTNIASSDLLIEPVLFTDLTAAPKPSFIRGAECDGSPALDIGDPIYFLRWQFGAFYGEPGCVKACDVNDDGSLDLADALYSLNYLFKAGPSIKEPYPAKGEDPTDDSLTCASGFPAAQ